MINKRVEEILIKDIQELVILKVSESKTVEYKKEIKISTDSDKKEFLADISSFANTNGGDLMFGINAVSGIPTSLSPLKIVDLDSEKLRIENIIRTGIDPRISFILHPIKKDIEGEYILVIRINESWNKPHRVIFGGSNKFYARNSAGKYELDVEELRDIFNLSSGLLEKINNFRIERVIDIESAPDGYLLNPENGKLILHIIPLESFSNKISVPSKDLLDMFMNRSSPERIVIGDCFRPMDAGGWSQRITAKGLMSYSGNEKGIRDYTELYKNGIVEALRCDIAWEDNEGRLSLRLQPLENLILQHIPKFLKLQNFLHIQPPFYVFITLAGVKGCIVKNPDYWEESHPINKDILYLPEAVIENYDDDLTKVLKPSFDMVWNNLGIVQSPNYDKDGNYKTK
jgi:hypothetical protein